MNKSLKNMIQNVMSWKKIKRTHNENSQLYNTSSAYQYQPLKLIS